MALNGLDNVGRLNTTDPKAIQRDTDRFADEARRQFGLLDQRYLERKKSSKAGTVTASTTRPILKFGEMVKADTRPGNVSFILPRATGEDNDRAVCVLKEYNNNAFSVQTTDGSLINGSYQRVENFTQLGVHFFLWTGKAWYFQEPTARVRLPQVTPDTVGLWNMSADEELTDSSGNGFTLTVEAGTLFKARLDAHLHGVYFDGSTSLWHDAAESRLRLTGAMTFICFWVNHTAVNSSRIVSHGANGELEADNDLYGMGWTTYPITAFLSESGAGTNALHTANALLSMPGQLARVGFTRTAAGVVQFWHQGKKMGGPSAALTTPTGGGSGRLRLGSSSAGVRANGAMAGAILTNTAWSDAQMIADYQRTMGLVHGFVSEI